MAVAFVLPERFKMHCLLQQRSGQYFLREHIKNLNHDRVPVVMATHKPVSESPLLLKDFSVFLS